MRAVLISAYVVMLGAIACTGPAHAHEPHGILETISSTLYQFMNKYMTPYARSRRQVNLNDTGCMFNDTQYYDGGTVEGIIVEGGYENLTCTNGTWTNGTRTFIPWPHGTWADGTWTNRTQTFIPWTHESWTNKTWVNGKWENEALIDGEWTNGTWIFNTTDTSPSCEYKGAWYTSGTNIDEDCISRTCESGVWHIVDHRCAYKGVWHSRGTQIDEDSMIRTCEDGNWAINDYGCPEAEGFFRSPPESKQCLKTFRDKKQGSRQGRSWEESDSKCKSEGLVLAKPNNAVFLRKDLVERYGEDFDGYWVGARANGTHMKWQQGGLVLDTCSPLWRPEHPGERLTTGHCLELRADDYALRLYPHTQYTSWNCSWPFYTLCELIME